MVPLLASHPDVIATAGNVRESTILSSDANVAFSRQTGYNSGVLLRRPTLWLSAAALGVAGVVTAAAMIAGGHSAGTSQRDNRWRRDIAYLARRLPQVHVNALTGVSGQKWFAAAAQLEARVPRLSDGQLIVGIMSLVALLRDDETVVADAVHHRPFYLLGPRFPLGLQWIGHRLYVIAAPPSHRALLGSQLIAVSSVPVSRVVRSLRSEIDHNNSGVLAFWETQSLISADLLSWLGVTHSLHTASYTFRTSTGKRVTVRLTASRALAIPGLISRLRATFAGRVVHVRNVSVDRLILTADGSSDLAHVQLPMYQANLAVPYWMKVLAARHAVYLKYNNCLDTDGFQRLAARALTLLRRHPDFRLIIDLRDNPGGDTLPFQALITGIRAHPAINRPGRIIGLVNQLTGSSATYDAYELTSQTKAILIGQTAGDPVDDYGNSNPFLLLPGSGIGVKYSTQTFDSRKIRMGVPDIYVAPTIGQILGGQDPVLQAALRYSRRR